MGGRQDADGRQILPGYCIPPRASIHPRGSRIAPASPRRRPSVAGPVPAPEPAGDGPGSSPPSARGRSDGRRNRPRPPASSWADPCPEDGLSPDSARRRYDERGPRPLRGEPPGGTDDRRIVPEGGPPEAGAAADAIHPGPSPIRRGVGRPSGRVRVRAPTSAVCRWSRDSPVRSRVAGCVVAIDHARWSILKHQDVRKVYFAAIGPAASPPRGDPGPFNHAGPSRGRFLTRPPVYLKKKQMSNRRLLASGSAVDVPRAPPDRPRGGRIPARDRPIRGGRTPAPRIVRASKDRACTMLTGL